MRILAIALMLFASLSAWADFCYVNNIGQQGPCFPTLDGCRFWARGTIGGGCALSQDNAQLPQRQPSFGEILQDLGKQIQAERAAEQQQRDQITKERGLIPGFLLPLVDPQSTMSQETISIIVVTLNSVLEMDSGVGRRNWRNQNTGSYGDIEVSSQMKNQYGDTCREYQISMSYNGNTQNTGGVACRQSGQWRTYPGASLPRQTVPSSITNPPERDKQQVNSQKTKVLNKSQPDGSCSTSYECMDGYYCLSGRCKKPTIDKNTTSRNTNHENSQVRQTCKNAWDCKGSKICRDSECIDKPKTGEICNAHHECEANLTCKSNGRCGPLID